MGFVTNVFLPLALALIMFAMGLGLTLADFKRVISQPKNFFVGAGMQVIALPIIAFGLVSLFAVPPMVAVGVMIIAACPGGTTSNLMTHMAKGDVALSISLTAVVSILSIVTVPLIVTYSLDHFLGKAAPDLPVLKTVIGIFAIVTVPTVLGMIVRRFAPGFADWAVARSRLFSAIVFFLVVVAAVIVSRDDIVPYFAAAGLICLILNLVMLTVAHGVAAGARLGMAQRITIAIECGFQNATLGIVVATTLLQDTKFAIPSAVYGLIMFVTGLAYVGLATRRMRASA
jgi:BASS family bile acid:Na+ symporter